MPWIDHARYPLADALAAVELRGLARGARLVDDLLKAADVRVLASEVFSGARHLVLVDGGVESLGLAYDAALAVGGDRVVDAMILPHAHPALGAALGGTLMTRYDEDAAILLVETETLSSTFRSVDAALKAVPVALSSWRLGRGLGGRAVFALRGDHAHLEAAEEAVLDAAGGALLDVELIPRPDPAGLWEHPVGQGALS